MRWEVSIPTGKGGESAATVTVDAENWLAALKAGLVKAGEQAPLGAAFSCQIEPDETVKVADPEKGRVYTLRPLGEGAPARASRAPAAPVVESFAPPKPKGVSIPPDPVPHRPPSRPAEKVPSRGSIPAAVTAGAPPVAPPVAVPVPAAPVAPVPVAAPVPMAAPAAVAAAAPSVASAPAPPPAAPRPSAAPARAPAPAAPPPPPLPQHQIFARRDENPDAGNPLTYRDRLFAVPPGTRPDDAVTLLKHYFAELQLEIAGHPPGKFINLAAFDHVFKGRPDRPALAALSWKDWRGADPEISFPAASTMGRTTPTPIRPTPVPVDRRRKSSGEIPAADGATEERLAEVFEAMQDLFLLTTQREAAAFALDLALDKIPCEAGSTVLNDVDRGDLYFAAVRGPAAERLTGVRLEHGVGLIGAAARSLETIAIPDAAKDARFNSDFDKMTGFQSRTILCAPLLFEGRSVGAIELLNKLGGGAFTQGDINVLSYIGENLGNFVATSLPESDDEPAPPMPTGPGAPVSSAPRKRPRPRRR